ncbi:hypothetical protein PV728_43710 [Streptomyces europaeiscabiei]|uniref:hypothetical protein n=1 Tax=Streptomyces europaeiscabiei TaxID=146819 RepID=UPI0029AB9934|nr:hypothetical protein [Streptomyces europaeiscabiei]MDX3636981.1 hypothetical protein [Streptomyces europaeiscabiei]MDX3655125.1 hypothetical protein [Streptomyces europaeiscabiei]
MSVHDLTEVQLESEQLALLAMIGTQQAADPDGQWPMWDWVEYKARSFGMADPRGVLDSLPRIGASGSVGLSYGFTTAVPRILTEDTRIKLTVAAAWALDEARYALGEPFLQVLHHMITLWRNAPRSPNEVTKVSLTSEDLQRAFPQMDPRIIRMVPDSCLNEPFWSGSSGRAPDGSWNMDVPQRVKLYERATDLRGYVSETCRQVHRVLQEADRDFTGGEPAPVPSPDAVLHRSASRTALLMWLWHQKQQQGPGEPMPNVMDVLSDDGLSVDQGVRFTEGEIDRASAYLERHGLIKGGGTLDQMAGPVRAEITPAGEDCVEGYSGDVGAYIRRRDNSPVTFHIATNNGNIAANSTGVTQNAATQAAFDPAQILAVVSLIRQLTPALTPHAGEQQALLAQTSELQAAAEAPALDRVAVRRITDGVLSTIRRLTHSPDVQRLALEAVEQGIQNP